MPGTITGNHSLYDASLVVNGVDLSAKVESVTFEVNTNMVDAAAMGNVQDFGMASTLSVSDPTVTFYQDYAAAKTYATLYAAWLARTPINIVGKASSGARSTTNPEWTLPCIVKKMPLLTGKRGDRHMAPVTFGVAGDLSVLTA